MTADTGSDVRTDSAADRPHLFNNADNAWGDCRECGELLATDAHEAGTVEDILRSYPSTDHGRRLEPNRGFLNCPCDHCGPINARANDRARKFQEELRSRE